MPAEVSGGRTYDSRWHARSTPSVVKQQQNRLHYKNSWTKTGTLRVTEPQKEFDARLQGTNTRSTINTHYRGNRAPHSPAATATPTIGSLHVPTCFINTQTTHTKKTKAS